jgi:protein-disulfide isomerase
MKNEKKNNNSSIAPIVIIGLVLVAAIVGVWWFSGTQTQTARTGTTKKPAANTAELYAKASPGANPPHSLGAPNAAVMIEEFADFQCGACAGMHPVVKELRSTYGDRVRIVFRHFPLNIPQHSKAYEAAVATEAAGMQGKFWDMQNILFANQQVWSRSSEHRKMFQDYAQKIGLDVDKFLNDMAGGITRNRVDADLQRGRSLNVNSTPTFYINGRLVSQQEMSADGMRRIIDAELQKTQAK